MNATLPDRAFVQEALEAAPFHRWLGLSVTETGADEIKLLMPWRDELEGAVRTWRRARRADRPDGILCVACDWKHACGNGRPAC